METYTKKKIDSSSPDRIIGPRHYPGHRHPHPPPGLASYGKFSHYELAAAIGRCSRRLWEETQKTKRFESQNYPRLKLHCRASQLKTVMLPELSVLAAPLANLNSAPPVRLP